ncbi:MAG: family 65 glycosyl hydrolase, partial [Lachnospiraceae bacterium]|nr:family 65 glycosyl hydrolase [Lachnospiraceae bacterium]
GKEAESFEFFKFATRMDLDNYNRNTCEGLHTTSIVAAWMNIVYGFGGLTPSKGRISIAPMIPKTWKSYSFRILAGEEVVRVKVDHEGVSLKTKTGKQAVLTVYGRETTVSGKETRISFSE